jgi:DMSO/TMAO reductase YedYZ molybdopterin-dependent catalytic subunit
MATELTRRDVLQGLFATGVAMEFVSFPMPALAQGEVVVPFTDVAPTPPPAPGAPPPPVRFDPKSLQSFIVSNEEFFAVQHYGIPPVVDPASYKLRITGLVEKPMELTLADLRKRAKVDMPIGFECSGNNNLRGNPLVGNARWGGLALAPLLKEAGLKPNAREVVFFSNDKGAEEVTHGRGNAKVEQHFARSLTVEDAGRPEVTLAYEMNDQPLPQNHGAPIRLIVPGWYGVANVKWLDHIHVQETRLMSRFMSRDYVTLKSQDIGGETIWFETWVSRIRLKSAVTRLTRNGNTFKATGFALTDGTPLKAVEVKVDNGGWKPATMWKENTAYSWKLFSYEWTGAPAGEHTIVSRAIDSRGDVQPDQDDPTKKSQWENNGQHLRKFTV